MNPDDTLDTIDTTLDHAALDTEIVEGLDTEQIPSLEGEETEVTAQTSIAGWDLARKAS